MTTTACPAGTVTTTGSGTDWVSALVAGPRRQATVLHSGPSAVYLDVSGGCLAVLARHAVLVPCGVRTPLPALPGTRPGDAGFVGGGWVMLPSCAVSVDTVVPAWAPSLTPVAAAWGSARLGEWVQRRLAGVRAALPGEALQALAAGDPGSVTALLGLGPGLTPLGDDVLCGWLAAAAASQHAAVDGVRREVARQAARRTTTLSATLLTCASRGEAVPQFGALLGSMAATDGVGLERSADQVLRIGDTSGAGLLLGALLALQGHR